ncbi:MAG TPA: hypothetical protein VHM02_02435 [Thermoanaerobaculia bacterium]|nr:hypothetical protein [Thermoanaerobaculia bacterium]
MTETASVAVPAREPLAGLATDTLAAPAGRQIAPPYAGGTDGIQRSQVFPPSAPPDTWMAWRADRTGGIVAQLGSRSTTSRRLASILVGYQFVQNLATPGNSFWTASLRADSLTRLPEARAFTYGFMTISSQPHLYTQPLVAGRTHVFTLGQWMHPAGRLTVRCGVIVSIDFGPGQTAYVEAIARLQSLVQHGPTIFAADGESPAASLAGGPSFDEIATVTRELDPEAPVDLDAAFDGLD